MGLALAQKPTTSQEVMNTDIGALTGLVLLLASSSEYNLRALLRSKPYIYLCMHTYICTYIHMHKHGLITCMYVCMYVCMHAFMHVRMCMYACVLYIYTHHKYMCIIYVYTHIAIRIRYPGLLLRVRCILQGIVILSSCRLYD